MAGRRPHADDALAEARSRARRYEELQKKTAKNDPKQMDLGFDAKPPSRNDAKHLVDERRKEKAQTSKPKAKTVVKRTKETSPKEKAPVHHAAVPHTSPKAKQSGKTGSRNRQSSSQGKSRTGKKVSGKKTGAKKKKGKKSESFKIQLSLPLFIGIVVVIALMGGSLIGWKIIDFRQSLAVVPEAKFAGPVQVSIEPGMSARSVSELLEERGVIADAKVFERYVEVNGNATRIQSGTFTFESGLTHALIADMLINHATEASSLADFPVYAGFTIADIDDRLAATGITGPGAFADAVRLVASERGLPFAEGWFLGGTYRLDGNGSVSLHLARAMQDAFNDAIRPYLILLDDLDISLSDVVVIASLIQRETNDVAQMPGIAGVIYNRLEADMPIGIDASLRYGLDVWDRPLLASETSDSHPYNTRRIKGLPPTGIGAPSLASIDAAFKPAQHGWYYYIHDKQGNIHFTTTYAEHQDNIEKFLE